MKNADEAKKKIEGGIEKQRKIDEFLLRKHYDQEELHDRCMYARLKLKFEGKK